ncbi:MAG: hypothetical protein H7138_13755, partial [Myxococcales bacterium]|nr:hypothetical protein [Myxococcales bacterium]
GVFRTAIGALDGAGVTLRPQQLETAGARLVVYRNDDLTPVELAGPRTGDRFATGRIEGDPLYVVAMIDGTPWFVASRKAWRWQ